MGVEQYLICISHKHYEKQLQLQTVELKVAMDCDGCELKVNKALSSLRGVKSVKIDRKQLKVTVIGYVEESKVLKKAKSTGKKAEIWPYVPYNLVPHPYIAPIYDKKAPPGYVRYNDVEDNNASFLKFDDPSNFVNMFSDDNPNGCSIM
ncbi:unnamed protein product [Citrullus colocynthis]|uniref:HMA domain-containing protein n=1 Tax=Citrullus colocynthis TaxID=252529 RepID=A0ABP0YNG0_9ROSI